MFTEGACQCGVSMDVMMCTNSTQKNSASNTFKPDMVKHKSPVSLSEACNSSNNHHNDYHNKKNVLELVLCFLIGTFGLEKSNSFFIKTLNYKDI